MSLYQKVTFDKSKMLHPLNVEKAEKYKEEKGWFGDEPWMVYRQVVYNREKDTLFHVREENMDSTKNNKPYCSAKEETFFSYFYPAPEFVYRVFTDEEMLGLIGKEICGRSQEFEVDSFYKDDRSCFLCIWSKNTKTVKVTSEELLSEFVFTDNNTPCGVRVKED